MATGYLQRTGQSIDQFVDGLGYSKKVKKEIAEGWQAFNEVDILFREKWFRDDERRKKKGTDYIGKGTTILTMPELDAYHEQIEKHYGMLGINTKPRFGKKKTKFIETLKNTYNTSVKSRKEDL